MKRRNFLASLAGICAAPFGVNKAEEKDPRAEVTAEQWAWKAETEKEYIVAVDWARDPVNIPDRSSVMVVDAWNRTRQSYNLQS